MKGAMLLLPMALTGKKPYLLLYGNTIESYNVRISSEVDELINIAS
jgi:hypothetical protein